MSHLRSPPQALGGNRHDLKLTLAQCVKKKKRCSLIHLLAQQLCQRTRLQQEKNYRFVQKILPGSTVAMQRCTSTVVTQKIAAVKSSRVIGPWSHTWLDHHLHCLGHFIISDTVLFFRTLKEPLSKKKKNKHKFRLILDRFCRPKQ